MAIIHVSLLIVGTNYHLALDNYFRLCFCPAPQPIIPAPTIAPNQANGIICGLSSLANTIVSIDDAHNSQPNNSILLKYLVTKLGLLSGGWVI